MDILGFGGLVLLIGAILFVIIAGGIGFLIFRSWVKVARADEALVISGANKSGKSSEGDPTKEEVQVVIKGKAIVNPLMRRYEVISLRSRQVPMTVQAQSQDNITVDVTAVAIVKIGSTVEYVSKAAERFSSQDEAIVVFTTDQLEGALRGVVARLSVVELLRDRKKFGDEIAESVSRELSEQGLILDSFQIKTITDHEGYIDSLGVPEIQAKHLSAEIAKTNTERATRERVIQNQEEDLIQQTQYEENQAASRSKVGKANAEAEQAEELARAAAHQRVLEQRAKNKASELDSEVRAVADAELYQAEKQVDQAAYQRTRDAQVAAEVAEHEALAVRTAAEAEAESTRLRGEAKASAIRAEADALAENQQAVLAQRVVEILPELMMAFADGYQNIGNVSIVGGSGSNGGSVSGVIGAENAVALHSVFENVKVATGVDLGEIIQGRVVANTAGEAFRGEDRNDAPQTGENDRKIRPTVDDLRDGVFRDDEGDLD